MPLEQPGLKYTACGPLTKSKKHIKKFKEAVDSKYIYQNKFIECFRTSIKDLSNVLNKIWVFEIIKI